jgi:hypothetical protein
MKPASDKWLQACRAISKLSFEKNVLQGEVLDWWWDSESRFMQILGGERGGKSLVAAFAALTCMKPGEKAEYWIVGPDYRQARPEFLYLHQWLEDAGWVTEVSMPVSETAPWSLSTTFGATIRTRTAGDVQKLASFSVAGIVMAEAAQCVYEAFLKLMGRVSETSGFLILSGTLEKGLPWYGDLYERWQGDNLLDAKSWSLPSWSNLEVYPGGRDDPRIKELEAEFPEDLFMERFGALPQRKFGLVLPEFDMKIHVKRLLHNPKGEPVQLAIDPGQHTYAVLFLQYDGLVCNVLDRVYVKGMIAQDVIPKTMGNPLWKYIDLQDAGTIDVAGKQHHANKSQVELWREIAGANLRSKYIRLDDTIGALRYRLRDVNPLHQPLLFFNNHMTNARGPDGIALDVLAEPLGWRWPDRGSNQNLAQRPIDKNNDALKAIGYNLVQRYGIMLEKKRHTTQARRGYW